MNSLSMLGKNEDLEVSTYYFSYFPGMDMTILHWAITTTFKKWCLQQGNMTIVSVSVYCDWL